MLSSSDDEDVFVSQRPAGVPDDAIVRVLRVPPESAGMRVDVFVHTKLRNTSRTRARAIVENTAFSSDGRRLRPSDRVHAEDRIVLWRPPFEEPEAPEGDIAVLYEDEHVLIVDKPPLMTVHPTARHYHHTLIRVLRTARPTEYLSLVHRLDRETSGLLIVARSTEADRAFKRLFEDRTNELSSQTAPDVTKTYLAITWGSPPSGLVDRPLEPDPDNPLRVKMRIAATGNGMRSLTDVELLETRGGYALVRCALHTGRQHQIRVHLASMGCAVVGDKLYGPDERLLARAADGELDEADLARLELARHALHAHRYRLPHAMTGASLDVISPLPPDLQRFWDGLSP
jgi:23S rRNA pseudouridine1911/1915/1917 synthase